MGRKTILTLTLIIILAIAGVLYFYLFGSNSIQNTPTNNFFKSILPFSNSAAPTNNNNTSDTPLIIGTSNTTDSNVLKTLPRLRHYTTDPIAGNTMFERSKDVIQDRIKVTIKETIIRYMSRATGHIYDFVTTEEDPTKISNTTIPKVSEATFTPGGNSVIARFLDNNENIITYYVTLKDKKTVVASTTGNISTSTSTVAAAAVASTLTYKDVSGTYLTKDIKELALSTSGKKIINLTHSADNGIFSTLDSNLKSKTILTSPLQEWLLSYPTDSKAVITTKPSGITYGYSYILNTDSGSFTKLVGNILGMTILPNKDASMFLVGQASESLKLFNLDSKSTTLSTIPINTLPEKCVWSHTEAGIIYCAVPSKIISAVYPDDWYKGRLFFNDSIWKINIKTGETNIISNLSQEGGQLIDAINLQLSQNDKYLTFMNKRDLTLWGIDLNIR